MQYIEENLNSTPMLNTSDCIYKNMVKRKNAIFQRNFRNNYYLFMDGPWRNVN